jgi:hypothetical protein
MVEVGHQEAEGDEGNTIKVYVLYAGRKKEGATSCNVKVQGSGGLMVGKKVYWYTSRDMN